MSASTRRLWRNIVMISLAGTAIPVVAFSPRVNEVLDRLQYGTDQEKVEAAHEIGHSRVGAGIRYLHYFLNRFTNGIYEHPQLVSNSCESIGLIGFPEQKPILKKVYEYSKAEIKKIQAREKKYGYTIPNNTLYNAPVQSEFSNAYRELAGNFIKTGVSCLLAWGRLGQAEDADELIKIVNDKDEYVEYRIAAVRALSNMREPSAETVNKVKSLLASSNPRIQVFAAKTVLHYQIDNEEAARLLIKLLTDQVDQVRLDTAMAMKEYPRLTFILPLERALFMESNSKVASTMRGALSEVQSNGQCCHQP